MTARFASQNEIEKWNNLIITNPDGGNIFQAIQFSLIKAANNWKPLYVVINDVYISILQRKIPFLGNFWYVPKGPGVGSTDSLKALLPELHKLAKHNGVFAVKLEPELFETPQNIKVLKKLGLKKSKSVQAANTVILDISKPIDNIVAGFSSKTRGNIRAAQKANVKTEIVPTSDDNCAIFYEMMKQTIGTRSHVRSYSYYKNYWQSYSNDGNGIFMFAKANNTILSMDFITIIGKKAARKDAASTRDHSIRGASALLELAAIEHLREKGITQYDLYGSPPSSQIKNPSHPYFGFGTFKVGFNPQVTDFVGCYDLIIKPTAYKFWQKYGDKIVRKIYYYKHHDLYY